MGFLLNRNAWFAFYILVLAGYLVFILSGLIFPQPILKSLLMPVLALFFITSGCRKTFPARWIFAALFFSWAGDVLLMFYDSEGMFFLAGLSSFLVAHICYILFFSQVRKSERIPLKTIHLLPVALYYVILLVFLGPHLGDMMIPVVVYGLVISIMLFLALHAGVVRSVPGGRSIMTGALLFIISDSLLAINKFHTAIPKADFFIIATYGCAQLLLTSGAAAWIKEGNTR